MKITAVSYLNTFPFVYGIKNSGILKNYELELCVPSMCAKSLFENNTDIALVPVAALAKIDNYYFVSDYCIGANGSVKTVLLLSNKPLDEIDVINLDFDSLTSINLIKILAKYYWKRDFIWKNNSADNNLNNKDEAAVLIGDKTFEFKKKYKYIFDLAFEWKKFTGLPFVFACWVSRKQIDFEVIENFEKALKFGIDNKEKSLFGNSNPNYTNSEALDYLTNNISFIFDEPKKEALQLYLSYLKNL